MAEMLSGQVGTFFLYTCKKSKKIHLSKCTLLFKVLFPGKGPIDHMQLLLEVVGTPGDDVLKKMISKDVRLTALKCHKFK